ncbi:hypothetical protein CDAR_261941 [Caerostris darwini]|uniref:C2H2-type domain-containing protein n=1 Tax=Caerostris darwini TaxID=1538125 RepID=A0AAV4WZ09_9ARAC|nr:hypothetical protein CDAR_261941 [Caerostris darwini]
MPTSQEKAAFEEGIAFSVKHNQHGIRLYCCSNCSYTTPYKGNLKAHVIIHSDVRPFVCDVCHKSFTQKIALQNHFRVHSGERPYKCDICGKTFAQSSVYYQHKKTHLRKK